MGDNQGKFVPPAVDQTAFNCPHCGALAKQTWFKLAAHALEKDELPLRITEESFNPDNFKDIEDKQQRQKVLEWAVRVKTGRPLLERNSNGRYSYADVFNVNISQCFNCNDVTVWIGSALAWPLRGDAPMPNGDLPEGVRLDFEEAGRILNLSPPGAAALLRLSIQKLCKDLGEKGKNIDDDIAALVKKGLDVRVQQALDVVRVIGNQAVHPGQIDLRDDRSTAEKLFGLVNPITEIMITQPKHITAMFDGLPEGARKAIERRDNKALSAPGAG